MRCALCSSEPDSQTLLVLRAGKDYELQTYLIVILLKL